MMGRRGLTTHILGSRIGSDRLEKPVKVVILAGGYGTRISEESANRPKPLIEIGERPVLWHIMKTYSAYGYDEFVICCGYRGSMIKEYFGNYFLHNCDVTFDMRGGGMTVHHATAEPWKVTCVDTGADTQTGGRLKRVRDFVEDGPFMLTYGDGVADVDISKLVEFHAANGHIGTVTAVQPAGRFGSLTLGEGSIVEQFAEKPDGDRAWVSGGYFVLEPPIFDYIDGDQVAFEREPLERLAAVGQLDAYEHRGFWQPMDTQRDRRLLEELWASGRAPWKLW
jgi:glucose-1-phosphate cytidylyltransferase